MNEKKKHSGGRPKEKIADKVDLKLVERAAALGLTDIEMASLLGVCVNTIDNWKKDPQFFGVLKAAKVKADSKVIASLYDQALAGNTTASIFWLKNRQRDRWRDVNRHEVSGPDGAPLQINLSLLSDEELKKLEELVEKANDSR